MEVNVLRLDHRRKRDARITTHVCLTARAFGASKTVLSGEKDSKLMKNVEDVVLRWGGKFKIVYRKNWENYMDEWQKKGGEIVHLTMYGTPIQEAIKDIKISHKDKLVVVGGSRVPTRVYKMADHNISVTSQPHSEVSSLAVFLHMLFEGKELQLDFEDGDMKIIPTANGKKVITQK
mgnify:CR=1 FL=1